MAPSDEPSPGETATIARLQEENLNLRIDNRGKEQAINFLTTQVSSKDQMLQDLSYRLGAAETRVAQLAAPKSDDDTARHAATETAPQPIEAVVVSETPQAASVEPLIDPPASEPEPKRTFFARLLG